LYESKDGHIFWAFTTCFDLLTPGDANIEIPIIERKNVLIMNVNGQNAQVMDQQSNEIYDMELPEDLLSQASAGKEAEVLEAMGRRKMERIR
jgi:translation initiation factor 5A